LAGPGPIRDSIGGALRFTREHWRFVLMVAGAAALAHTVALLLSGGVVILWLAAMMAISCAVYAAFTRAALADAPQVARAQLIADAGRTLAAMAIVGFFFIIVMFMVAYVAMSVIIAPYAEQAKALESDQAGLMALMERAISEQPSVVWWSALAGIALLLLLTSRLYFAAPASVDRKRILVFESWRWTRGHLWRIVIARVALLAPALIFAGALQSLFGMALGLNVGDPTALAAQAPTNPLGFIAFFAGAMFIQTAIYTSLEAALSAHLYRALAPRALAA